MRTSSPRLQRRKAERILLQRKTLRTSRTKSHCSAPRQRWRRSPLLQGTSRWRERKCGLWNRGYHGMYVELPTNLHSIIVLLSSPSFPLTNPTPSHRLKNVYPTYQQPPPPPPLPPKNPTPLLRHSSRKNLIAQRQKQTLRSRGNARSSDPQPYLVRLGGGRRVEKVVRGGGVH